MKRNYIMELYRQIKKNKYGKDAYTMKIGRSEYGLRRHHVNAQYFMAVPINAAAVEKAERLGQSPFRGLLFFINKRGNWDLTRKPEIWCRTPYDWEFLR